MKMLQARTVFSAAAVLLAAMAYPHADRLQATGAPAPPQIAAQASPASAPAARAVLDRYCVGCHNQRVPTANLTLDSMNLADIGQAAPVWEKVVRKLRTGTMPPAGRPRPEPAAYDGLASWLESELDQAAGLKPEPGRTTVHRLNRTEYANVIRDLLALEIDARALLPADDAGYGFDNNADMLAVSPGLLDRYMSAARKISRLAIGDVAMRPSVDTYAVSRYLLQDDRVSEELPFGTRGGLAVRHTFPLDGEYVVRIHVQRRRMPDPQELEVRVDGERIQSFTIGAPGTARSPEDADTPREDGPLEVRLPIKAGPRQVSVGLVRRAAAPEGLGPAHLPVGNISFRGKAGAEIGVDRIDIAGPYNIQGAGDTPTRRRIFVCRPAGENNDSACARQILTALARRAYRRPATANDLQKLLPFYSAGEKNGFEAGIQSALERILVDPQFLFRIERDPGSVPPGTAYRLTDLELASRLSFFLWSSMPDDELLEVAARGRLSEPAVLEHQVRRMLTDARARMLVSSFASQWLYLRNVQAVAPDVNAFPAFDDNLRDAFQQETELFLQSQLREDRSVVELLTANYTFVNERLARHYGMPNIYGSHFRRVKFGDDRRAGLLGQGSILTVTSYATRTSPVVRGKWLLENILGAPPPPPPPDVPDLPDGATDGQPASVRERMEQHRRNPACASCHAQMDPLGFALENFDAIGRWRTVNEGGTPIDASGSLPDGRRFNGPAELRRLLLARRENVAATVVEKLLIYALGRGLEPYDMPAVRTIVREAESSDYAWSSLVLGIARSTPFRLRRSES
jgi:mono/diheme cytochrome c family protein